MLSSVLVMAGIAGAILLVLFLCGRFMLARKPDPSVSRHGLRSPGQSLLAPMRRIDVAMRLVLLGMLAGLLLMPAGHLALSRLGHVPESFERTFVLMAAITFFLVLLILLWLRLKVRQRRVRLGLEGEVAVGEALQALSDKGYRIYHDFPAEQSNIGHIVIGPAGVLAVETKARPAGSVRRNKGAPIVNYDGRMLHFPKNSDHQTIDHAKDQALWLSRWLSEAVGDPISARAIVAVPGWHVKRTSADGIPVVNPKQFPTLFEHIQPRPLSDDLIQRIARCIEQQSRLGADEAMPEM